MGHPVVNEYSEIVPSHFYFPNTLFDDRSLDMSGCILPRTGVSGWNSFWFGSSEFDKTGRFSSFQAQVGLFSLKYAKIDGVWSQKHTFWTESGIWTRSCSKIYKCTCLTDVWTWFKFNDTVKMSECPSENTLEALDQVKNRFRLQYAILIVIKRLIFIQTWLFLWMKPQFHA